MVHTTPTKVQLTTPLQPLALQLSGSLAHGVKLFEQFLHDEPPPQKMANVAWGLSALLREVGRHIMAWVWNRLEPAHSDETPSRLWLEGRLYRRRRKYRSSWATLFGTVEVWRSLYEPLERGVRSMHPLELRLGVEAGIAPPALAERVGRWAAAHPPRQVLDMVEEDHAVQWSCPSLRTLLSSLRAGMAPYRHASQGDQVVSGLERARASQGRFRPTLSVGRDGIFVPLRHGIFPEGATATVSVLDRNGKRLGTVYRGHMPEPGQGTLTAQLHAMLQAILSRVDSQGLRLVYVTDDGYHPRDYSHSGLKKRTDPRRPWRRLEWRRMLDYSHACQYMQQLADVLFGAGAEAQSWAKQMRKQVKTKADGVARA
jgi:hypothetical protein